MREEIFGIASFRSRQQVMQLESALRRMGVPASIVTTPGTYPWDVDFRCALSYRMPARFVTCISIRAPEI